MKNNTLDCLRASASTTKIYLESYIGVNATSLVEACSVWKAEYSILFLPQPSQFDWAFVILYYNFEQSIL